MSSRRRLRRGRAMIPAADTTCAGGTCLVCHTLYAASGATLPARRPQPGRQRPLLTVTDHPGYDVGKRVEITVTDNRGPT